MESTLTRKQSRAYGPIPISGWETGAQIKVEVRFDDECGNGHNAFAITGEIFRPSRYRDCEASGCLHDEIAKHFPKLAPLIKWHLMSTDGPLHYVENARYWAGYYTRWCDGVEGSPPNMENLKSTIVYGALPEDKDFDLSTMDDNDLQAFLCNRLPALLKAFKGDIEALGFAY